MAKVMIFNTIEGNNADLVDFLKTKLSRRYWRTKRWHFRIEDYLGEKTFAFWSEDVSGLHYFPAKLGKQHPNRILVRNEADAEVVKKLLKGFTGASLILIEIVG